MLGLGRDALLAGVVIGLQCFEVIFIEGSGRQYSLQDIFRISDLSHANATGLSVFQEVLVVASASVVEVNEVFHCVYFFVFRSGAPR